MNMKFTIIEGSEKFRVVDLVTGGESFTNDKLEAYRYAGLFISWGHPVRLEERDAQGKIVWYSESAVLVKGAA